MSNDPRNANCQAYHTDASGKVDGVELTHFPAPETQYALLSVDLIGEAAAQGNTTAAIHVLKADGSPATVQCYLGWPWPGWTYPNHFGNTGLPGNSNYPYQHMITNAYNPSNDRGPLAIFIGDAQGNVLSDVIGGFGLPAGRHVCYTLTFKERGAAGGDDEETGDSGAGLAMLQEIRDEIKLLRVHLGA